EIDIVFVVTNDRFHCDFVNWAQSFAPSYSKPIHVLNDGTRTNESRLGAIGDLVFVVNQERICDDCLVVAGDNLFDFELRQFVEFFKEHGTTVGLYVVKDMDLVRRYSIVELDAQGRIIYFEEKPQNPKTNLVAICLYLLKQTDLPLLHEYQCDGQPMDAPGYFIQWLHKRTEVYGFPFHGIWFDIGDHKSLEQANRVFSKLQEE
ncbi:MAG TPA: nucleotidyltransferase family protein, partial [Armatimonadetes bacterium]|nr:nucleotidyltransferase family protein [Armatimonadota bacterium]